MSRTKLSDKHSRTPKQYTMILFEDQVNFADGVVESSETKLIRSDIVRQIIDLGIEAYVELETNKALGHGK